MREVNAAGAWRRVLRRRCVLTFHVRRPFGDLDPKPSAEPHHGGKSTLPQSMEVHLHWRRGPGALLHNTTNQSHLLAGIVRIAAGLPTQHRPFSLAQFIGEVRLSAALEAKVKGCQLTVSAADPDLALDADRDLLLAAVGNLLQNAFKFTRHGTEVTLNAYAVADRILIDVEDHCGGLPPGDTERMFQPFMQGGIDVTGLGLGLSVSRLSVESNAGILSVRDAPGSGVSSRSTCPAIRSPRGCPLRPNPWSPDTNLLIVDLQDGAGAPGALFRDDAAEVYVSCDGRDAINHEFKPSLESFSTSASRAFRL